ncbi:flavin reductase family protein [Brevundimonas sp. 2R-24]|uniref:Flavin reductase family protein n=1 Tax=Peiella sedimenti TaxID=3061083 RepID=A0ABT8SJJ3_9CAUL|nr:flavin reductase family protein [Caulobacteraceae bacterium XZ-24]
MPPLDPTIAYRRALGAFATGVCVVTADSAEGPLGLTVNSFTSVSLTPPLILWCLEETSARWPAFATAERFAVHVLGAEQAALAERFATGICRLESDELEPRVDGEPPLMPGALTRLICTTTERTQAGDHLIVLGRVDRWETRPGDGLVFYKGWYSKVEGQGR